MSAVGYRFHPTDEELINHFLFNKVLGHDSEVTEIAEVDVCKYEPWDLPGLSVVKSEDEEWYFFCPRDYKYSNSQRANRATRAGYWKPTGKTRNVTRRGTKEVIATKKTLVFYRRGFPKAAKTNWVMHEYIPNFNFPVLKDFVVCCLKKNPDGRTASGGGETSFPPGSDSENQVADASTCDEGEPSGYRPSYGYHENYVVNSAFPEDDSQLRAYMDSFRGYNEQDYSLHYGM